MDLNSFKKFKAGILVHFFLIKLTKNFVSNSRFFKFFCICAKKRHQNSPVFNFGKFFDTKGVLSIGILQVSRIIKVLMKKFNFVN